MCIRISVIALVASLIAGIAPAAARGASDKSTLTRTEKPVAGGTHWRISSKSGPVHVWIPAGYKRESAGLVVYVHGYYDTADSTWKNHQLAQQFRRSRQNAMFLVIEAPSSNQESVRWDSLTALKQTVRLAGMRLPDGPTVAIAHSGGFRTLAQWVDNRLLAQVILLDALYGAQDAFDEFIDSGKHAKLRKMVLISSDTATRSNEFARRFRYAVIRNKLPASYTDFSNRERRAKLLYIRSQYGHSEIVAGGKVIPLMLRITPLALL